MTNDPLLPSKICTALMRLGTRLATGFDQQFASRGITQAQFRVLLAVCEQGTEGGGLAPSALADYLLIERATVSVLSSRLVERGLLARTPGANRRTFLLSLTAQGQETLAGLIPHAVALADETLTGIPPKDLQQIWETLATVEARLRMSDSPHDSEADT